MGSFEMIGDICYLLLVVLLSFDMMSLNYRIPRILDIIFDLYRRVTRYADAPTTVRIVNNPRILTTFYQSHDIRSSL